MADAGLLQAHRILVKPNAFGKLLGGLGSLVFADSPPAGLFIRYTLPGMTPTLKDNDDESSVNQETA